MNYDEISSDEIFSKYLNDMLSKVKKDYNSFSEKLKAKKEICCESLFKVANDDSYVLSEVDYFSRHTILIYNAELVMSLFKLHNIEFFLIDEMKNSYSPFYRIIDGKKILYYFSFDYIDSEDKLRMFENSSFDEILVVRLVESGIVLTDFEKKMSIKRIGDIPLNYVSIIDVMNEIGEVRGYDSLIALFKLELRNYLGLITIHVSSKEKMNSFKSDIIKMLESYDFKDCLRDINDLDFNILKNHFSNNMFLLIGESHFAKSFISSEWRYSLFATSEHLEQTSTVVGYIKSLEQFMFSYLMLKKDQGVTIKKNSYKKEYIEITTDRKISDYSIEFQPLVSSLCFNKNLWFINNDTLIIIKKILDEYKSKIRNEHLHKDNIYSENEVDEIRKQTLVSFYLLLGGLKINEKELEDLQPYYKIDDKTSLTYDMFERWLDNALCGNILLDTTKCLGFDVSSNTIRMYTYESIKDNIPQKTTPINVLNELRWDIFKKFDYANDYSEREKMWDYYITTVESLLKQYINFGKCRNILLSFSELLIGFGFCRIKKIFK